MITIPHFGTPDSDHDQVFDFVGVPNQLNQDRHTPTQKVRPIQRWQTKNSLVEPTPILFELTKPLGEVDSPSSTLPAEGGAPSPVACPSPTRSVNPAEQQTSTAIHNLRGAILERFPLASPTIVLFLGSENNPHTHTTCARVAASIADKSVGKVLLVDSCPQRKLTLAYNALESRGVSNLLSMSSDWQHALISLPQGTLDFLPAGTSHWEHWGAENRLFNFAAELKRKYQFVFVNAGDAHHSIGKLWSSVCDGSYLLVSMKNSNPDVAESAVTELQASGARLLGCIATDFTA